VERNTYCSNTEKYRVNKCLARYEFYWPDIFHIRTIVHCVTNLSWFCNQTSYLMFSILAFLVFQSKWKKYYTIDIKVWLNFFSKYNCLSLDNLYPFISVPFLNKKNPEILLTRYFPYQDNCTLCNEFILILQPNLISNVFHIRTCIMILNPY
jgi:hypothetical protein